MTFPARNVYCTAVSARRFLEGSSFKMTRSACRPAAIRPTCFDSPNRSAGAVVSEARIWRKLIPASAHQRVFLTGIIVDGADVSSKENRPSGGEPGSQLADFRIGNLLLGRDAVVAHVVLEYC